MTFSRALHSEQDTIKVAEYILPLLHAGDVIFLYGGLGSGKTYFVKQLGRLLGVREEIDSPSFVLYKEYRSGRIPLNHLDLFRLNTVSEVLDLGIFDILADGVICIEWPELAESLIPHPAYRISFDFDGIRRTVMVEEDSDLPARGASHSS